MRWLILLGLILAWLGAFPGDGRVLAEDPAEVLENQIIAEVQIKGNQRISTSRIQGAISTQAGNSYEAEQINRDIKAVQRLPGIQAVYVRALMEAWGLIVVFEVSEDRVLSSVEITGNRKFSEEELRDLLPAKAGGFADGYLLSRGGEAVAGHYRQAGYHRVSVTLDTSQLASQGKVIYSIVEGPRTRVREIIFEGNKNVPSKQLRGKVGSKPHTLIFSPGNFDPEQVEKDVIELRLFLRDKGYLDANVGKRLEFSADQKWVTIVFLMSEGPLFRVRQVSFEGNRNIGRDELIRSLKVGPGEVPVQTDITTTNSRRILEIYGQGGYAEAEVQLSPIFSKEEPGIIDLVYNIDEGRQYRVGRIDIFGNEVTQDRVIRRQLKLAPDDIFDVTKLDRSKRRLLESNLFGQVEISDVPVDGNLRDIKINVVERPTAMVMAGFGVTSDAGVVGDFSLEQRNFDLFDFPTSFGDFLAGESFRGAGQYLRLQAQPGSELSRFVITFREPYVADLPISFAQSIYLRGRSRDDYDEQRFGGLWSLGYRFAEEWEIEGSISLQEVTIENVDADTAKEIIDSEGSHKLTSAKGTLIRDRTDSSLLPTRGDRFRISYEQTGVFGGDYDFGRLEGSYSMFFRTHTDSLERDSILALHTRFGTIIGDAPYFDRFYAGGISSIRGFDFRGVSPRVPSVTSGDAIAIGSDWIFLAGAEYSFPLVGQGVRGAAFIDSGIIEDGPYRTAIGFSIRLMMPLPLSADFAWPISRDGDDDTRVFSFSLASMFQ